MGVPRRTPVSGWGVGFIEVSNRLLRRSWNMPLVGKLLELDYDRTFSFCPSGRFRGVFESFAEAERAVPPGHRTGYDHAELAGFYRNRMHKASESDYGPLFWLRPLVHQEAVIFDFGGHVGVSYHAWQDYLRYPPGMRWIVYDVPAVTQVGEEIAREKGLSGVSFTNDVNDAVGCSAFVAFGSLQYVEESLPALLERIDHRPAHIVLSKMPVHDGDSFVTLQATGAAFHPYRIFNRDELVGGITALGYRLVDDWVNREQSCFVPFTEHPPIRSYSGFYFTREASA